jgi:DNA-binding NtrC family response regulator
MLGRENLAVRDRFIGTSDAIANIRSLARKVAATKISVLISGESGTGKEVVARMIHDLSPRREENFVPVNCGAIPEGLFESEMFGHERGSFTGAEKLRKGYFEQGHNGTIFLDEVGEMPLAAQVKVLRALESGEFYRVGGSKVLNSNVRIVAATNRDLRAEVDKGNFREDLYFRLKAIEIPMPPLRDRPEDIPSLIDQFVEDFCIENEIPHIRIMPDALNLISNGEWRGNVRELKHFISTLLTMERESPVDISAVRRHMPMDSFGGKNLPILSQYKQGSTLENEIILRQLMDLRHDVQQIKDMVAQVIVMGHYPKAIPEHVTYTSVDDEQPPRPTLNEIEQEQIRQALSEYSGNRRKAAESLGIGERTLYRKIKEYNL